MTCTRQISIILSELLFTSLKPRILETQSGLVQAGLDSLGAVELKNAISSCFSLEVPATLAFDYPTESALFDFIVSKLQSLHQKPKAHYAPKLGREQKDSLQQTSEVLAVSCRYPERVQGKLAFASFGQNEKSSTHSSKSCFAEISFHILYNLMSSTLIQLLKALKTKAHTRDKKV